MFIMHDSAKKSSRMPEVSGQLPDFRIENAISGLNFDDPIPKSITGIVYCLTF